MYHLPAYLALARLVFARRVVVIAPRDLEGPRQLLRSGAREVLVVGADLPPEAGILVRPELGPTLPLRDGSVDVVCAVECFGSLPNRKRRELLREAHRVARPDGVFAAWIEQPDGEVFGERLRGATTVDFWSLEDELSVIFQHVYMLAQMPWRGFSIAPVIEEDDPAGAGESRVRLEEGLLDQAPVASHYLAVAGKAPLPPAMARECLLVPLELDPGRASAAEVDDLADELDRLREELSVRAARAAAAQRRVQELEGQLSSLQLEAEQSQREQLETAAAELEASQAQLQGLRAQLEAEASARREAEAGRAALEGDVAASREREGSAAGHGAQLEARLGELQAALAEASATLDTERAELAQVASERDEARAEQAQLEGLIEPLRAELAQQRAALEELEAARAALEGERDELARRASTLEGELAQLRSVREELGQAGDARAQLASQLEARERELASALDQRAALEQSLDASRSELDRMREQVRAQETDLSILTRTLKDHDAAFARLEAQDQDRRQQLEAVRDDLASLRGRAEATQNERDELRRQVDVVLAEREGARSLAARVEAELEVARRRMREQEEQLASKIEEASRVSGEADVMRRRLVEQESMLAESRTRTEQLTAQAEQGRMLADVALDRDRLREELGQRRQQIQKLEERLWQARDALQKEKIEAVRLGGELERYKEQAERSRAAERERAGELEQLGRTLREAEVGRAELEVALRMRDERISQLSAETTVLEGRSEDLDALRAKLEERGNQLAELSGALEQARLREKQALDLTRRRERELDDGGRRILELQRIGDEQAKLAAELSGELEVKDVQIEELAAQVANLQRQIQDQRNQLSMRDRDRVELGRRLEDAAAEQRSLRKQLRQREQELDDLAQSQENSVAELFGLRRELEAAALASEQQTPEQAATEGWPEEARQAVQRLEAQLAARERHASVAQIPESDRLVRFRREAEVRAAEQEYILSRLDAAEQNIWEMTDASDRNAARFAASLAQLEKQKEKVDQLVDELEVTRSLLSAEQARALEQERLLASERAKMARAGIDIAGFPRRGLVDDVDELFADLSGTQGPANLVDLNARKRGEATTGSRKVEGTGDEENSEPGTPDTVDDRGSSAALGTGAIRRSSESAPQRARMLIEVDEGEDEWPEEGAVPAEASEGDEAPESPA